MKITISPQFPSPFEEAAGKIAPEFSGQDLNIAIGVFLRALKFSKKLCLGHGINKEMLLKAGDEKEAELAINVFKAAGFISYHAAYLGMELWEFTEEFSSFVHLEPEED